MNKKQLLVKQIDENIEGNTLTLGETRLILEDGLTIGGKILREISEASNHKGLFNNDKG